MTALPSDAARYGWIVALGEAKLLQRSGSFTPGQWREVMGRHARYLKDYTSVGLLHVAPQSCDESRCRRGRGDWEPDTLVIHDWPVYQREHAVRQSNYRDARTDKKSDTESDGRSDTESDTPSRALSGVVSQPYPGGGSGGNPDAVMAYHDITGSTPRPGKNGSRGSLGWLNDTSDTYGDGPLVAAMTAEWAASPDFASFFDRVNTRLAAGQRQRSRDADDRARYSELERQRSYEAAMSPEERAANTKRLGDMLRENGLLPAKETT